MTKELEGAIENYNELKRNKHVIANIDKDFFFDLVDILLQALENSIPKEVVEEKITELWVKCPKNSINEFMINERNNKIEILQELLGGK